MTYMDNKDLPLTYKGGAKHVCAQFCKIRYEQYILRKELYLKKLEEDLRIESLRLAFVEDVISGRLDIRGANEENYVPYMEEKGYPDTFLGMAYRSFSKKKADALRKQIEELEQQCEKYRTTHPGDLWLEDLQELKQSLEQLYPKQWEFPFGYGELKE